MSKLATPSQPKVLILFGPTASGKSALALKLAQALNGSIINADSRQIYQDIPILTACPSAIDYATAPHHLYEFLPVTERFSAAAYATLARQTIDKVITEGKVPIVVGGTGFYIKALLGGLSPIPASDPKIEAAVAAMAPTARFAALQAADPLSAAILHPNDTQRTVRALTLFRQTGQPLSVWKCGGHHTELPWEVVKIALCPPRPVVHEALRRRWEEVMPSLGLRDEANLLVKNGYSGTEPGLGGLAIPLWLAHARNELSLAEVTQKAIEADRQYAKRQYTWAKNSFGADVMLSEPNLPQILAFLQC
jgi:tRNA dimethylallyltransferase